MSHNKNKSNDYKKESQYKSDMKREEKNSRKIAKRFKDCTGFSKVCKQSFKA